jgi:hypothetical protein
MREALIAAITTAGAALSPVYGLPSNEPGPDNETACHIASFAAKVSEWAIRSAQEGPAASTNAALEAYTFAREAAHAAEVVQVLDELHSDLTRLRRVADRGRWSDDTPVPAGVFELLADASDKEPWWKFW